MLPRADFAFLTSSETELFFDGGQYNSAASAVPSSFSNTLPVAEIVVILSAPDLFLVLCWHTLFF